MPLFDTGPPQCDNHNSINLVDDPDEIALFSSVAICLDCCSLKSSQGHWTHITVEILGRFLNGQSDMAREGMDILRYINSNFDKDFPEYTEEEYLRFAEIMKKDWDRLARKHKNKREALN